MSVRLCRAALGEADVKKSVATGSDNCRIAETVKLRSRARWEASELSNVASLRAAVTCSLNQCSASDNNEFKSLQEPMNGGRLGCCLMCHVVLQESPTPGSAAGAASLSLRLIGVIATAAVTVTVASARRRSH